MREITSQGGPFCLGGFPNIVAQLQKPETGLGKGSMALDKSMTLPMNAPRTKHSLLSGTDKPAMSSSSGPTSHQLKKTDSEETLVTVLCFTLPTPLSWGHRSRAGGVTTPPEDDQGWWDGGIGNGLGES